MMLRSILFLLIISLTVSCSKCSNPLKSTVTKEEAASPFGERDWATLEYEELVEGKGASVVRGSKVLVKYDIYLPNGKKVESLKEATDFVVGEGLLIPAWEGGLPGMREGGKRRIFAPSHPSHNFLEAIPPNSALVFDVELIRVY